MQHKKVPDFVPGSKKETIHFLNFGSEGLGYIVHISNWDVYEMPALKKGWRKTLYLLDHEERGIKINSIGFQNQLKPFWDKKASLLIRRTIPKGENGKLLTSATIYKVNQFNEASLWCYEPITE